ncbi:MAG: hypothetical protein IJP62_13685 [Treponema sp.]|nr:hypothetical protein [Treponema sp.]
MQNLLSFGGVKILLDVVLIALVIFGIATKQGFSKPFAVSFLALTVVSLAFSVATMLLK